MTAINPYMPDDCNETSDVVCSSFQRPDKYSPAENFDSTVRNDTGCTKELCCEKDSAACTVSMWFHSICHMSLEDLWSWSPN